MKNRQWRLARRPQGTIQDSDFDFVETDVPRPGEGEVLVRTLMLSCDPTQRGWLARDTYMPAVEIGEVVRSFGGAAVPFVDNRRLPLQAQRPPRRTGRSVPVCLRITFQLRLCGGEGSCRSTSKGRPQLSTSVRSVDDGN